MDIAELSQMFLRLSQQVEELAAERAQALRALDELEQAKQQICTSQARLEEQVARATGAISYLADELLPQLRTQLAQKMGG